MLSNISSLFCSSLIILLKKYCNHSTVSHKSQHRLIIIHSTERNLLSTWGQSVSLPQVTPALHVSISNRDYKSEPNQIWISTFVSFQESFMKFQSKSISSYRNNVLESSTAQFILKGSRPLHYHQLTKKTMTAFSLMPFHWTHCWKVYKSCPFFVHLDRYAECFLNFLCFAYHTIAPTQLFTQIYLWSLITACTCLQVVNCSTRVWFSPQTVSFENLKRCEEERIFKKQTNKESDGELQDL